MAADITLSRVEWDAAGLKGLADLPEMAEAAARWATTIAGNVNYSARATSLGGGGSSRIAKGDGTGRDAEGVYGKVSALDPGWHLREYGSYNSAPTAPFRNGVQAGAVRFIAGGKG